jgi:hypothetical protein
LVAGAKKTDVSSVPLLNLASSRWVPTSDMSSASMAFRYALQPSEIEVRPDMALGPGRALTKSREEKLAAACQNGSDFRDQSALDSRF